MSNLQLLSNKQITIDSREVAEMMDVEHSEILKKLEGTKRADGRVKQVGIIPTMTKGKIPVSDYFIPNTYKDGSGKENKCYLFTKMGCEFITNKFTGEKGILFTAKYTKKFNQMKQQLQQPKDSYMIQDPIERAKAWIMEQQEKQKLLEENEKNKPKVLFAEALEVSESSILIGELAKLLRQNDIDIGQNRLFEKLRNEGYLIKKKGENYNLPTQYSMDLKLFEIKKRTINNPDGSVRATTTTKVTGKGQIYFINKFIKKQVESEVACTK
ncbi:phage antirepressor KilAC domain-containing protein [Hathewaya histolytica]|uniref:Phage antirepressor KilAC-like protein n=1 Tax=Hathewaya histolytica TaxID=1498 RepID=A0A4U9RA09_HATHI|nr:phage antirepressor KilAC domain-containing protein [Hathewaya histolytica]VTQ88394.1 phage antirepressor KilAC-like protein [Hathewaya histolytica]